MINSNKLPIKLPIFNLNKEWSKMSPWEFWNELGSPKYICAPMVDQSELPFRIITRKYGAHLTYTPMIHSVVFTTAPKYRKQWLEDIHPEEQPCIAQFCGHDPEILLKAAKLVEDKVPCVDLNLGCPQGIARRGNYGSFLLEKEDLVLQILTYLSQNLKCGVSCKIRLYKDVEKSYELVKKLESTGIKLLCVHGRTKEQNKHLTGVSDWESIRKIKELVNIPIIANGGMENREEIVKCFEMTNCDAVMSAEKLLENPFLFHDEDLNIDDVAIEYINLAKDLNYQLDYVRSHLFKFYYQACKMNPEFNQKISTTKTYDDFLDLASEIREFRIHLKNEQKFGWYFRYRKDENPFYCEDLCKPQESLENNFNDKINLFN